jgi:hypothetical protein
VGRSHVGLGSISSGQHITAWATEQQPAMQHAATIHACVHSYYTRLVSIFSQQLCSWQLSSNRSGGCSVCFVPGIMLGCCGGQEPCWPGDDILGSTHHSLSNRAAACDTACSNQTCQCAFTLEQCAFQCSLSRLCSQQSSPSKQIRRLLCVLCPWLYAGVLWWAGAMFNLGTTSSGQHTTAWATEQQPAVQHAAHSLQ